MTPEENAAYGRELLRKAVALDPCPGPWDAMESLFDAAHTALEVGLSEETFLIQARCAYRELIEYQIRQVIEEEEEEGQ